MKSATTGFVIKYTELSHVSHEKYETFRQSAELSTVSYKKDRILIQATKPRMVPSAYYETFRGLVHDTRKHKPLYGTLRRFRLKILKPCSICWT